MVPNGASKGATEREKEAGSETKNHFKVRAFDFALQALEELPFRIERVEDMQDVGLLQPSCLFYDVDAHFVLLSDTRRRPGHEKEGRGVPVEGTGAECGYSVGIYQSGSKSSTGSTRQ